MRPGVPSGATVALSGVVVLLVAQLHDTRQRLAALEARPVGGGDNAAAPAREPAHDPNGAAARRGLQEGAAAAGGGAAECGPDEVAMAALNASVALSLSHARLAA